MAFVEHPRFVGHIERVNQDHRPIRIPTKWAHHLLIVTFSPPVRGLDIALWYLMYSFNHESWSMLTFLHTNYKEHTTFYGICKLYCGMYEKTLQLLISEQCNSINLMHLTLDRSIPMFHDFRTLSKAKLIPRFSGPFMVSKDILVNPRISSIF